MPSNKTLHQSPRAVSVTTYPVPRPFLDLARLAPDTGHSLAWTLVAMAMYLPVSVLVTMLLVAPFAALGDEDETQGADSAPEFAETMSDALQISHRLISRVSENFSCNAPYDVEEFVSAEGRLFVTRIHSDAPQCRSMLRGLNTWGELYGILFVLKTPTVELDPDVTNIPTDDAPENYEQTLIYQVDPDAPTQDSD